MSASTGELRDGMTRRVADILEKSTKVDWLYDRENKDEYKVTTFDRDGAAEEIGGLLADLVAACEAARDTLYPEYADVREWDAPEYARCPACDRTGRSPGHIEHAEGCAMILCEKALDRAKGMPETMNPIRPSG